MNILVTGACGFIGRAFISLLLESPHRIFALDRNHALGKLPRSLVQFYIQDITKEFMIKEKFDFIFHLAACNVTHVDVSDLKAYCSVNVRGTENVIKATRTRYFIFLSTAKVYQTQSGSVDEAAPVAPKNDYEKSKLEAEDICRTYVPSDRLTILRSVNIAGPGQAEKAVIPMFFKNAYRGDPLKLIGSPETPLQLLYIADLLKAFDLIIAKQKGFGVLNLSCDETISLEDLAKEIIKTAGSVSKIEYPVDCQKAVFSKVLSQKAKDVLGWQACASIKESIQHCHRFYSKQQ